jgi:hypothetical protein
MPLLTGLKDSVGSTIHLGDLVNNSCNGLSGRVVFLNGAVRYDIGGTGMYLDKNSSLMFCDNWKPEDFTITLKE